MEVLGSYPPRPLGMFIDYLKHNIATPIGIARKLKKVIILIK